jgi:phosphoribosylformylglycinamidine synthase
LSEGGLAVAAAEMAFAGGLGAELTLAPLAQGTGLQIDDVLLFSESNTRFLLEVPPEHADKLERLFAGLPLTPVGSVGDHDQLRITGVEGRVVVEAGLDELKSVWLRPLAWS